MKKIILISLIITCSITIASNKKDSFDPIPDLTHEELVEINRSHSSDWLNKFDIKDIKDVQKKLKYAGFYTGEIDGVAGPETRRAITDFQAVNNLDLTGTLNQATLEVMNIDMGTTSPIYSE